LEVFKNSASARIYRDRRKWVLNFPAIFILIIKLPAYPTPNPIHFDLREVAPREQRPMRIPKHGSLQILTRSREISNSNCRSRTQTVELSFAKLEELFTAPISTAAEKLGVSMTALKW
jgi:hypothetical protein